MEGDMAEWPDHKFLTRLGMVGRHAPGISLFPLYLSEIDTERDIYSLFHLLMHLLVDFCYLA